MTEAIARPSTGAYGEDPSAFVAKVSRTKQLFACAIWLMFAGLMLAPALVAPLPVPILIFLLVAGLPMLGFGLFTLVASLRRRPSSLLIDRTGWLQDGCMDEPLPWDEVISHERFVDGRTKQATIRMILATPHAAQPRFRAHGNKLYGVSFEVGRQSVVLGVSGYDRPPRAIRAAFQVHLDASRRRRSAES
jgi:hypothetical protein